MSKQSKCEMAFREFVHATKRGRCDDMPDKGCRCFSLPIQGFTEWNAWQAAMEHAARVAESYAELHDNCFENARTKDTTETMEVHACHANAGREIEAKLRGRDE